MLYPEEEQERNSSLEKNGAVVMYGPVFFAIQLLSPLSAAPVYRKALLLGNPHWQRRKDL
jgi:hypothetical protein